VTASPSHAAPSHAKSQVKIDDSVKKQLDMYDTTTAVLPHEILNAQSKIADAKATKR
jgi:hypothetical protein